MACSYCPVLLNYCNDFADTKICRSQPKMLPRLKNWKIIITLIIFMFGDIEKNLGPYNISGIVQASFSQGHEKSGVPRGI